MAPWGPPWKAAAIPVCRRTERASRTYRPGRRGRGEFSNKTYAASAPATTVPRTLPASSTNTASAATPTSASV